MNCFFCIKFNYYCGNIYQQGKINLFYDGLNLVYVFYQWVNNLMFIEFCFGMIGRVDIEELKSNVVMNV